MKDTRFQKVAVVIASGTGTANVVTPNDTDFTLPAGFSRIEGIAVHEITGGGIGDYDIGIREGTTFRHESISKQNWLSDSSVAPNDKFKSVNWQIENRDSWSITTSFKGVLSEAIEYQVVLVLS